MQQIATRHRVFEAADAMRAAGQTPTRDAIRAQVGGSDTTISGHLREWKAQGKSDAPVSAQAEFETVLGRMIEEACRPLHAANGALVTQLGELAVELDDAHAWRHEALTEQARQHADALALRDTEIATLTERLALAGQQTRHADDHALRYLGEVEELRRSNEVLSVQLAEAQDRVLSLTRREAEARLDAAIWQERAQHQETRAEAAEHARDEANAICDALRGREDDLYAYFHQRAREDARNADFVTSADKLLAQMKDLPLRVSEAITQPIRQARNNASQQDDQGNGAAGGGEERRTSPTVAVAAQAVAVSPLGEGAASTARGPEADTSETPASAQVVPSEPSSAVTHDEQLTKIFESLTFLPTEAPG